MLPSFPSRPQPRPIDSLPYLPLHYFVAALARPLQWVLAVGYVVLVLLCIGIVWAEYHPWQAVVQLFPVADTVTSGVELARFTHAYRTLTWEGVAQASFVNYGAGMVTVNPWLVSMLAASLAIGWSFLLAATSRVKAWWAYIVFFLVGVWVVNSNASFVLVGPDEYRLYGLALTLALLLPAFLFRERIWTASLFVQTLVYLGLFSLWFGAGYMRQGLPGILHLAGFGWPVLVFTLVIFLLLFHREVLNLILAAGLLRRDASRRQPAVVLLALLLLVWAVQLLMWLQHLGVLPDTGTWLRPSHLFVVMALGGLWTIGNLYGTLQERIPAVGAFYLGLLGLAILSAGVVLYGLASGELLFRTLLADNLLRGNVIFQGLYILYLLVHFWPLLRRKANVYFGLMRPPRPSPLGYTAIWFMGVSLLVFLEGRAHWRSTQLARATFCNIAADYELLRGNPQGAITLYRVALDNARFEPKANHNLAALRLQEDPTARVQILYADAEAYVPFLPARISHANLLRSRQDIRGAATVLRQGPADDAMAQVNLAAIWLALDEADSAVVALQTALHLDPDLAAAYANLGFIYAGNQRHAEARRFLAAGADVDPHDPWLVQNRIWYGLQADSLHSLLPPLPTQMDTLQPLGTRFNLAVLALHRGQYKYADAMAATLPTALPEAMWLRLASQAQSDSLSNALSRYQFLANQQNLFTALGAHTLGMAYFRLGLPEMAAPLLNEAAAQGRPADSLAGAMLLADIGAVDSALRQLDLIRAHRPELYVAASQEAALLLYAAGSLEQAALQPPPLRPNRQDSLRMARQAGLLQRPDMAGAILSPIVGADSNNLAPYIIMGQAWLASGKTAEAIRDLAVGLSKPTAQRTDSLAMMLRAIHLQALTQAGQLEPAREAAIRVTDTLSLPWRRARAQLALALGNPTQAIAQLEQLHREHPFDVATIASLGEAYLAQREFANGLQTVSQALTWNDRNAALWLMYAKLAIGVDEPTEAANALNRAAQYVFLPTQRASIQAQLQVLQRRMAEAPQGLAVPG